MKARLVAAAAGAVVAAFVAGGCGGTGQRRSVPGAGKGVGYGLRAAGLQRCLGPVSGVGDTSTPIGAVGPVTLSLYSEPGFAALVASGASAQQHAIDLTILRSHAPTAISAAAVAATERSWRREVLRAISDPGAPRNACRSELPRLPVLAATEVVCPDEVLIPLGRRAAMDRFIAVLSGLLSARFTPAQFVYLQTGNYITIPQSVTVQRVYCRKT